MIHTYGYEDGKRGVEARYVVRGDTMRLKISGSDHWWDYLVNFLAWPRRKLPGGLKFHRKWFSLAEELGAHLHDPLTNVKTCYVAGHSMGGTVAAILPMVSRISHIEWRISLVNAPKCGNRIAMENMKKFRHCFVFYDRGDIVRRFPLFYARYPSNVQFARNSPFWRAHNTMPRWWDCFLGE